MATTINTEIAGRLKEVARLLDEQGANQFRVRAYQRAAETLKNLKRPVDKLIKAGGLEALQKLPGIGPGLARSIEQFALTGRLPTFERLRGESELLDVDREYREKAGAGRLRKIAPKRFNPTGRAWLPVLHTKRGKRRYTALFSNTALAHELGKTHDWVVLYYDGGDGEKQCTVVTAKRGPLAGRRVVRGQETESAAFYNSRRGGG